MKLIISEKEIANFLVSLVDHKAECLKVVCNERHLFEALKWASEKKGTNRWLPTKHVPKAREKILTGIARDLEVYRSNIETVLENRKNIYYSLINNHLEYFIEKIGEDNILKLYRESKSKNFVKSLGLSLNPDSLLVRRNHYINFEEDCLFRNMNGNENLLFQKMQNNWPFWFIDTGYTNFLIGKGKKWHRVVRNNFHHSNIPENIPVDRLGNFESFPQPWRNSGDKILIIEPGVFCAKTFNLDIETWKKQVIEELRKHTDKKIIVREKLSKKVRKNLYRELCEDDYYCVVNINSNAAVEAVWAGVPVITLQRHISNPVAKSNLNEINNLFRGNIASWLSYISYSQFTYDEIINGTAAKILKKYHE